LVAKISGILTLQQRYLCISRFHIVLTFFEKTGGETHGWERKTPVRLLVPLLESSKLNHRLVACCHQTWILLLQLPADASRDFGVESGRFHTEGDQTFTVLERWAFLTKWHQYAKYRAKSSAK
jgi:hypothetical protein